MKRILLILTCLLLLCSLLAACTPDEGDDPKTTVPQADVPAGSAAAGQPADASGQPADPSGEAQPDPAGPKNPGDPAGPADPDTVPTGTEPANTPPAETMPPITGMDVEDEHTEIIGENVGVGGIG